MSLSSEASLLIQLNFCLRQSVKFMVTRGMRMPPTLTDIYQAAEHIRPYAHRTPVLTCQSLNAQTGAQLFLKCENLQAVPVAMLWERKIDLTGQRVGIILSGENVDRLPWQK